MKGNKSVRPRRRRFTVIHWNPPTKRPEDGSFVLMQLVDRDGTYTEYGCYEKGQFIFYYFDGKELLIPEESVLGWSYLPFWLFEKP